MAYGSPSSPEEILPYYTHMRGGRPPRADALAGLEERYRAIGGGSPLTEVTIAQARALENLLRSEDGEDWCVKVGMKHTHPFIEEAVAELAAGGPCDVVGLVLAPHYSSMSVAGYLERARAAAAGTGLRMGFVEDWHLDTSYLDWLAVAVRRELDRIGRTRAGQALVVFTAHSLPERLRQLGDPYPDQLGETAAEVARRLSLPNWTVGWQSVAQDAGEPWLGPELLEVVRSGAARGVRDFVVCACGFVADHLEVRYDLDLEAQALARELRVSVHRTAMPNADPAFIRTLLGLARRGMAGIR